MKLKLLDCEDCGHKTLMIKVEVSYVQVNGASEIFNAFYCPNCGESYSIKNKTVLNHVVGKIVAH